jgi:hypothetical protein
MNIKNINKAKILSALYNHAQIQGLGRLGADNKDMSEGEAQSILDYGKTYFDYFNGRVMKIDLSGDELRTDLYNRDNGKDAAEKIICQLTGEEFHSEAEPETKEEEVEKTFKYYFIGGPMDGEIKNLPPRPIYECDCFIKTASVGFSEQSMKRKIHRTVYGEVAFSFGRIETKDRFYVTPPEMTQADVFYKMLKKYFTKE